jgi:NADPH:quinone reductase-like Zn-dependent oxidoreductase
VQLGRHLGARVTAVTSGANAALVTDLGAAEVVDHTAVDVAASSQRFDVVLDCVGNLTIGSGRRLLADTGVLVLAVAGLGETLRARGNVVAGSAPERVEDFEFLLGLVASGALTVVHDSSFGLEEIVEAHRRVDTGHKRGNVIVRPGRTGAERAP